MYVKMLDGAFAGEVKDLRSDVALDFIRLGKAERAFQDAVTEAQPFKLIDDSPERGSKQARKRHGR